MTSTSEGALLFGDRDDPHILAVKRGLDERGIPSFVLDVWQHDLGEGLAFESEGRAPSFRSALVRPKPRSGAISVRDSFILRERRDFAVGLVGTHVPRERRINDPGAQDTARNKIVQLRVARSCGLKIPPTIVTNKIDAIEDFFGSAADIVYKPLTWLSTTSGQFLFCNRLSVNDLRNNVNGVQIVPGLYQKYIQKRFEYRITVVDSKAFNVRIHSQELDTTATDWRRDQFKLRYEIADDSSRLTEQIMRFMSALSLRFAAFDFIEEPSGELVFLEANPAGNWLWLEERLDLPISNCLADALI